MSTCACPVRVCSRFDLAIARCLRRAQTIEPEQLGAFFKPGGGVIEPTVQPPPELRMAGIQGEAAKGGRLLWSVLALANTIFLSGC